MFLARAPVDGNLKSLPGVEVRRCDQRVFGLTLKDKFGEKLALKPTGWMSNSPCILDRVAARRASGEAAEADTHEHSFFVGRDVREAERYPPKLADGYLERSSGAAVRSAWGAWLL